MTGEFTIAVHALVFLNHKACTVSSEALAVNVCTNPARIRKVMAKMKRAGFVSTREGAEGGYRFVGDPRAVRLSMVCEALNMPVLSAPWHSGDPHMECLIASGMSGVIDDIYKLLNSRCIDELERISIADIDRRIFNGKALPHM